MNRTVTRIFLTNGVRLSLLWTLALLGLNLAWAESCQAEPIKLIFGHVFAPSSVNHQQALWAADELNRRSGGRMTLEIFPRGQLGATGLQNAEAFATGSVHITYLGTGQLAKFYPPITISSGPFVFRDAAHWRLYRDSDLFRELKHEFEKRSAMHVLGLAYYGRRHLNSKQPIRSLADMKGLLIRVPYIPVWVQTFRLLGAVPVQLSLNDTFQALQDGLVVAEENPLPTIEAEHFLEVAPYISLSAHVIDNQLVVISQARWQALSPENQQLLAEVFEQMCERVSNLILQQEQALETQFRAAGVQMIEIDRDALRAKLRHALVGPEYPWGRKVYERVQALH